MDCAFAHQGVIVANLPEEVIADWCYDHCYAMLYREAYLRGRGRSTPDPEPPES